MSSYHQYTVIPDLLSITTNMEYVFYFPFGVPSPKVHTSSHAVNLNFFVVDKIEFEKPGAEKFNDYYVANGKLYFDHHFPLGRRLRAELSIGNDGEFTLRVERDYYRLLKIGIESVVPPGRLLFDLAIYLLMSKGYFPLHCSAFSGDMGCYALTATSNTGKSYTAFTMARKNGARLITEDIALYDLHGNLYSCPLMSIHSDYIERKKGSEMAEYLDLLLPFVRKKIETTHFDEVYEKLFVNKCKLDNLCLLERGQSNTISVINDHEALITKLIAISRGEFTYHSSLMLRAMEYFWGEKVQVESLMQMEREALRKLLSQVKVLLISGTKYDSYFNLIDSATPESMTVGS